MPTLLQRVLIGLVFLSTLMAPLTVGRADESANALKALQGKWIRRQQSREGKVTIVKEHKGNTTILTVYGGGEKVLYSHESEFKIERSGKTHIFTFFNRKITVGPKKPDDGKPVSFVFRVHDDRFVEAYGLLDEDTNAPNLIVWERVKAKREANVGM